VLSSTDWTFGLALSKSNVSATQMMTDAWFNRYAISDVKAVSYIARTIGNQRITLRATLGAGVVWTHAQGMLYALLYVAPAPSTFDGSTVSPAAEGTLTASLRLGDWALHAGPIITATKQSFTAAQPMDSWPYPSTTTVSRRPLDTLIWFGLRRAL
jgi:hypothetical protein